MDALDFGHFERAAGIPDQQRAGHLEGGHGLISALDDGSCAPRDDLAALQQALDIRMIFPLLERLEGLEARILVIQSDDEADIHAVLVQMIKKAASVNAAVERPARAVLDEPRLHAP